MKLDRAGIAEYAAEIRRIRSDPGHLPETSLYGPLEALLRAAATEYRPRTTIIAQHDTRQAGVPDFALLDDYGHPFAYVEAKEPGKRLDALTGAEKAQLERYKELPCVLYTNFFELRLYENGAVAGSARLIDPAALDPDERHPPEAEDLSEARALFERLFSFQPQSPRTPKEVADALARRARFLKQVVVEVMQETAVNPLHELHREFKDILFGDLTEQRFADAYAQTLTYGLLLARLLRPHVALTLATAPEALGADHKLLSAALRLLGFQEVTERIGWSVDALLATANLVDPAVLSRGGAEDPTIYFYEEFLAAYDKKLRKALGVYYTPIDVVRFQVRVIERLLVEDLGADGYADRDVAILDPATGTGTYLLGIFDHLRERVEREQGAAATRGALRDLASRAYAFELLVGPYAVARWRLTTLLREAGVEATPRVVLTDTLAEPRAGRHVAGRFGFIDQPLTEERDEAERIKTRQPIQVILGNPPYERTSLRAHDGDEGEAGDRWAWIWRKVDDFKRGVPPEERVNLKNLAERYVLFYRWAFWKLLEEDASGPGRGVVSFISNRSFLTGGAFAGMRAFMRERFQRIVIVDLSGDLRAARLEGAPPDEPVFDIQTGTAIAVCLRTGEPGDCVVQYRRLTGTREEKFAALRSMAAKSGFERIKGDGGDSFAPRGSVEFLRWPSLPALFKENFSGIQTKRDKLVVGVRSEQLRRNLAELAAALPEKARERFHETPSRRLPDAANLRFDAERVVPFGYRPLDRRLLYGDDRFIDRPRASMAETWGDRNLGLSSFPRKHGGGPAAVVFTALPDINSFSSAQGTSRVFPLWDHLATHGRAKAHNFSPLLMNALRAAYGEVNPESVFDYIYAVLQSPSYTRRFHEELQQSFPRVPFPKDKRLFENEAERGEQLVSLHCFERRAKRGENPSRLEGEDAAVAEAEYDEAQQRVSLGAGVHITEVTPQMWTFEVSGYPVLRRWLEARLGLTLTPEEVKELLAVIFAIRKTVEMAPMLDEALERILSRPQLDLSPLGIEATAHEDER